MGNNEWIQVTGNVPVSGGSAEGQTGSENVELNAEVSGTEWVQVPLTENVSAEEEPEPTNPAQETETDWQAVSDDNPVGGTEVQLPEVEEGTAQVTAENAKSEWLPFSYLDNIPDEHDPQDYRNLNHKPTINNVELTGNQTTESLGIKAQLEISIATAIEELELTTPKIYYHMREDWDAMTTLISKKNTIYVYVDYAKTADGKDVAGIKLGDGSSYVVDLPFLDQVYAEHIANQEIHVSPDDRLNWDAKVRCFYDEDNDESNLIFTTARLSEI